MQVLEQYAVWLGVGPVGVVLLALGLKRLRLWIVSKRPKPEETGYPQTDKATGPMYVTAAPEPARPVNEVEEYYKRFRRTEAEVEREVQLATQKAMFKAVEENSPQLLTIYDPSDVKQGDPLTKLEDFPLDDMRRQATSNHPAAGELGEVVILDFRTLPNDMHPGFMPRTFREKYAQKVQERKDAIERGKIKTARPDGHGGPVGIASADPKTQADIERHREYSDRVREQARRDFEELKPQIRADAEKTAREKFVPARTAQFQKEAAERNVDVKVVVEEFVKLVGDQAVQQAEERFNRAGPLNERNPLLKSLTGERMRKAGAWTY